MPAPPPLDDWPVCHRMIYLVRPSSFRRRVRAHEKRRLRRLSIHEQRDRGVASTCNPNDPSTHLRKPPRNTVSRRSKTVPGGSIFLESAFQQNLLAQAPRGGAHVTERGKRFGPGAAFQSAVGIDPEPVVGNDLTGFLQQVEDFLFRWNTRRVDVPDAGSDKRCQWGDRKDAYGKTTQRREMNPLFQ